MSVISEFLLQHEMDVYLVVFDRGAVQLSEKLFADVQHYVDTYYVPEPRRRWEQESQWLSKESNATAPASLGAMAKESGSKASTLKSTAPLKSQRSLQDLLSRSRETFSEMLLRLIDEKGYTDVEVYKRANMDRKLFSKIRSNKDYHPKKATVFALAIALRLSVDEATDLLRKAGYTFSDSYKQDIIVRYFLEQGEYDMFTINETLFCFEEPLLGA